MSLFLISGNQFFVIQLSLFWAAIVAIVNFDTLSVAESGSCVAGGVHLNDFATSSGP